ncbi:hypothetical protein IE53DRAFT_387047 [Violaceomyces palustris]|uniref:Uncharacterized protein n=1 Tax=Violaceomyces palustris TaxID=1673888 RepID=A0ACD0NXS2_9BASI|nr:hypothetical protein IE53DRAFT_387047 [Violaceomyces palustris]
MKRFFIRSKNASITPLPNDLHFSDRPKGDDYPLDGSDYQHQSSASPRFSPPSLPPPTTREADDQRGSIRPVAVQQLHTTKPLPLPHQPYGLSQQPSWDVDHDETDEAAFLAQQRAELKCLVPRSDSALGLKKGHPMSHQSSDQSGPSAARSSDREAQSDYERSLQALRAGEDDAILPRRRFSKRESRSDAQRTLATDLNPPGNFSGADSDEFDERWDNGKRKEAYPVYAGKEDEDPDMLVSAGYGSSSAHVKDGKEKPKRKLFGGLGGGGNHKEKADKNHREQHQSDASVGRGSGRGTPSQQEVHAQQPQKEPAWYEVRGMRGAAKGVDGEITNRIGWLCAHEPSIQEWTSVLALANSVSHSEAASKEAARALRKEFKYGSPDAQKRAVRIWALLSTNASDRFKLQIATKRFLEVVEDVISSSKTPLSVKETMLRVLGVLAFRFKDDSELSVVTKSWNKIRPTDRPLDGESQVPDMEEFTVPIEQAAALVGRKNGVRRSQPARRQRQSYGGPYSEAGRGIVPTEVDVRKLHEECQIARSNAAVLVETLATEGFTNDLVDEFYNKVQVSQDFLVAQIPWATAQADRSRDLIHEAQSLANSEDRQFSQVAKTVEESLLADLLDANERLVEASTLVEDGRRIQREEEEERRVTEMSKVEVRVDRSALRQDPITGDLYYNDQAQIPGGDRRHLFAPTSAEMTSQASGSRPSSPSIHQSPFPPSLQQSRQPISGQSNQQTGKRGNRPLPVPSPDPSFDSSHSRDNSASHSNAHSLHSADHSISSQGSRNPLHDAMGQSGTIQANGKHGQNDSSSRNPYNWLSNPFESVLPASAGAGTGGDGGGGIKNRSSGALPVNAMSSSFRGGPRPLPETSAFSQQHSPQSTRSNPPGIVGGGVLHLPTSHPASSTAADSGSMTSSTARLPPSLDLDMASATSIQNKYAFNKAAAETSSSPTSVSPLSVDNDDDSEILTPIVPSEKALGKRRAVSDRGEAFDPALQIASIQRAEEAATRKEGKDSGGGGGTAGEAQRVVGNKGNQHDDDHKLESRPPPPIPPLANQLDSFPHRPAVSGNLQDLEGLPNSFQMMTSGGGDETWGKRTLQPPPLPPPHPSTAVPSTAPNQNNERISSTTNPFLLPNSLRPGGTAALTNGVKEQPRSAAANNVQSKSLNPYHS